MPKMNSISFYDLRLNDFPKLFPIEMKFLQKKWGIVLQHKDLAESYEMTVFTKKSHEDHHKKFLVRIKYPEAEVPPLMELLQRSKHPEHDELRFELLRWTIDDKQSNEKWKAVPRNYFLDVLILVFMTKTVLLTQVKPI